LFVYPELNEQGELSDFTNIKVEPRLRYLYMHLLENEYIFGIDCSDPDLLNIYSREVIQLNVLFEIRCLGLGSSFLLNEC